MPKKIVIIAGETSGDLLGADLIDHLRCKHPDLLITGIGGEHMQNRGLVSLFPMQEITAIGFAEVFARLPVILARLYRAYLYIKQIKPQAVITIDSPGFNFRLIRWLRGALGNSFKAIHYVAPSVWAYNPERAKVVQALYDHILLLYPFEKSYFKDMPATYVGHPLLQNRLNSPQQPPLLVVMPGSRSGEIMRHAPIFAQACRLLRKQISNLQCAILSFPQFAGDLQRGFSMDYCRIITQQDEKERSMAAATAGLVKSGTSSLELLQYLVPMVVAYKVHPISAWYISRKLTISSISIANVIAQQSVIPEFLQDNCTAEKIAAALLPYFNDPQLMAQTKDSYSKVLQQLINTDQASPGELAATAVFNTMGI